MQNAFLDGGGDVKLVMFDADERYDGHFLFRHPNGRGKWLPQMDAFLRFHKLPTWTRDDVNALIKKLDVKETSRGFIENYVAGPTEKALVRQKAGGRSMNYTYGAGSVENARKTAVEQCEKRGQAVRGSDAQRRLGRLRRIAVGPLLRAIASARAIR